MAIGSTEQHYTASKIFQALLSKRPVFAMFHKDSSAVTVLKESNATEFLIEYSPKDLTEVLDATVSEKLNLVLSGNIDWQPDLRKLEKYSAKASAKALANKLNELTL
jgi:hypothetical protein